MFATDWLIFTVMGVVGLLALAAAFEDADTMIKKCVEMHNGLGYESCAKYVR